MLLTLRISSGPDTLTGLKAEKQFGKKGGTIGRSLNNDWVLPDPERFVSGRHAQIQFKKDTYYLIDTSTNGIFVNDSLRPISSGSAIKLKHGDKLRIGSFEISVVLGKEDVEIASDIDLGLDDETDNDLEALLADDPNESVVERLLKEDRDEDSLFEDAATADWGLIGTTNEPLKETSESIKKTIASKTSLSKEASEKKGPAKKKSRKTARKSSSKANKPLVKKPDKKPDKKPEKKSAEKSAEKSAKESAEKSASDSTAKRDIQRKPEALDDANIDLLRAFLKGAGLEVYSLKPSEAEEMLQLTGQMLREMILGLIEALQTRAGLKNDFRLHQTTIQPSANNPLKFSAGVEEAMLKLLRPANNEYMPAVDSVRESFQDIKANQIAMVNGMKTALAEYLTRFDPEELKEKFDRSLKRGAIIGKTNKMKYWDLYAEMYQVLAQKGQDQFPHLYGEEFVKAYEEEIKRIRTGPSTPRRKKKTSN